MLSSAGASMEHSSLHLMRTATRPSIPDLKCCCGQLECAYLKHNNAALEGLEKGLADCGAIGQALLIRHETYMAEAEGERNRMAANITKLEAQNTQLEAVNARTIEENRTLLSQLEDLNNTVTESDTHIKSLTATLESTRHELQRITTLAGRTAKLESQLSSLEIEQAQLQQELATTKEDERSAVQRWKRAERTVNSLQEQIDRIEKEAREERERNVEVMERLERRRAVEKELESAAGRLKCAAATSAIGRERNGSSVVSHFVNDILQDNTNLQLGIVELRDLLLSSNEELESLRERMVLHQPVVSDNEDGSQKPNLKKELGLENFKEGVPALHVHHHYYATEKPEPSLKDKTNLRRRSKKRPDIVTSNTSTPLPSSQTSRASTSRSVMPLPSSVAATILSQTSVTIPPTAPASSNRWPVPCQTIPSISPSSVPSSPQSAFRDSIFDRIDHTVDSSRPTSPESTASPIFMAKQRMGTVEAPIRSFSTPAAFQVMAQASRRMPSKQHLTLKEGDILDENHATALNLEQPEDTAIAEEDEDTGFIEDCSTVGIDTDPSTDEPYTPRPHQRKLYRSASHESILSLSGIDIHTLRSQPSQILHRQGFSPRTPFGISSPSTALASSKPVISAMTATARPAHPRRGYDSSSYSRSFLATVASTNAGSREQSATSTRPSLGERVGGWVWGKWGVAPMASTGNLRAQAAVERVPGVNQFGAIRGLRPHVRVASGVRDAVVDKALLREALEE